MSVTLNIKELVNDKFWVGAASKKRLIIEQGGTRSGKTYGRMQFFYMLANSKNVKNKKISICSESMPHLKRGAMYDFLSFLKNNGLYRKKDHNQSENFFRYGNGNIIEFFSVEDASKVHGASRDYLFVNEIQNIRYETFFQLFQRTNIRAYVDYNPTHEFWIHTEFLNNEGYKNDIEYIHSTILDNKFVSDAIKKDVLLRAERDENYKRVYLLGEIGSVDGLIFKQFNQIDKIPHFVDTILVQDFGFTNDPTAILEIGIYQDQLFINELCYKTGMLTNDIINFHKTYCNNRLIISESADPRLIAEIRNAGFRIREVSKFSGSVMAGIDFMKGLKSINVTKNSLNTIKEFRNYSYLCDKNGKYINEPAKAQADHSIDAIRYGCMEKYMGKREVTDKDRDKLRSIIGL